MNKLKIIIFFMLMSGLLLGQEFNCAKFYKEYCDTSKLDLLPNYTAGYFYSGSSNDTNSVSIPNCINDLDAFCSGIIEAESSDQLSIRQVGDPGHVSPCSYYSYEKYGINLIMTGDIITDGGIFDKNAGFNFVMKKRIKKSIGDEKYKLIGQMDSTWIDLNEAQMNELFNLIIIEKTSDTTAYLKMDSSSLKHSKFKNLNGVIFIDALAKTNFSIDNLFIGIQLKLKNTTRKGYLKINFKNYKNPLFCKSKYHSVWVLPIRIIN